MNKVIKYGTRVEDVVGMLGLPNPTNIMELVHGKGKFQQAAHWDVVDKEGNRVGEFILFLPTSKRAFPRWKYWLRTQWLRGKVGFLEKTDEMPEEWHEKLIENIPRIRPGTYNPLLPAA